MPIPERTSAEAFERYVGGKCLRVGRGKAWRDIKAWIIALPAPVDVLPLPSVSEPFLAWTMSGEVEFQEREGKRPWVTHRSNPSNQCDTQQAPWIVPIPGTRKFERMVENLGAAEVELVFADLREIDNAFSKITVHGARLSEDHMKLIDP